MSTIGKNPTLSNKFGNQEPFVAYLKKAVSGQIVEYKFRYKELQTRNFELISSTLGGHEYFKPTQSIRTSSIDLPFSSGDKIRMFDNRVMNIKEVERVYGGVATALNKGLVAYNLILEGGA